MLEIRSLGRSFDGRPAVQDLSLAVAPGRIVGLLGPNGAGKTTTLAMILHLVKPDTGTIAIGGIDVWRDPVRALAGVGALIEYPALYPHLSGADNLRIWAAHAGLPPEPGLLARVGLEDAATQRVETYSQGMRQRLGIALALLGQPRLIILDEPTVGIDPRGVVAIRALLGELAAGGATILLSSHQLGEVQLLCDDVILLNRGRCIAQGPVDELLGPSGRLLLRVVGDPAPALEAIRQWREGVKARLLEDGTIDVLLPAEEAAPLNAYLVGKHFGVMQLMAAAPSLEEYFLLKTAEEGR